MSSRWGPCHGRDLPLTESGTEEERGTRLLPCYAEVFSARKQNFTDKVLFLSSSLLDPLVRQFWVTASVVSCR